jgi:hypothetical protein
MPATFVLAEDLNNGEEGKAISVGYISGVDTSGFTVGDIVYVGENGGYTNIKPTGSNLIQNLGVVTRVDAVNGSGFIYGSGRSNAVPNLLNGQIFWGQNNTAIQKPLADILSGSNFQYSGSFTGSLLGTASLSISSSYYPVNFTGSSLVSSDAGVDANTLSSVILGKGSGENTSNATYLVSIGTNAGYNASSAQFAVFTGYQAGWEASGAAHAVAIGRSAGYNSPSGSHSILIGRNAGRSINNSSIGRNNIVIGTGITVSGSRQDSINIGALIFGSGSYFSSAIASTFSGSANGRIGINQPNPQQSFDVSGSVRISTLATGLTAPTTSGTTKMVITDANGDLSFTDVPSGGSLTIADEGSSQGTATFLNFSGSGVSVTVTSNTASIIIPNALEASASFSQAFTNQTLLTVTHNLDAQNPFVQVYDTNNDMFIPQRITATNSNQIELEFSAPTSGRVAIAKAGHIVSGSSGAGFPYTGSAQISGSLEVNGPITGYRKVENKNSGYTITNADYGKTFVCNSTSDQTFNLPSVDTPDIGFECTILKVGSGKVTIDAADSDTIQDSGAGDTIYCSDTGIASITLLLARPTSWYITSAVGTWITTD